MDKTTLKKRLQQNGVDNGTGGVISNGFHGYKEGYEAIDKSKFIIKARHHFHHVFSPIFIMTVCPLLVILFWFTVFQCNGSILQLLSYFSERSFLGGLWEICSSIDVFNNFTFGVVFGYCAWAAFWMKVLPGKEFEGPITEHGNTPIYKDNGFSHYIVTMIGFVILTVVLKQYGMSPSVVYDRFGELIVFMNVVSAVLVLLLYFKGVMCPSTTDSGQTGNFLFDYYWGTELYPRVFGVDVKVFTNCRFGMTIWPLLVCIYAIKSYEMWGFVDSMFITTVLQLAYITKFFTWEAGYMRTIDIILDRAGFYICWGCLCWLPSLYPLISFYLVNHPVRLGLFWSSVILGVGLLSILINYLADIQKQNVRSANGNCLVWGKKPNLIRAKYLLESGEERSSLLLASGWWGITRHFHYVPEIMLSFCWSCTAGVENLLPYSYVIFLVILLTHRSFRDDHKCSKKYGQYWKDYCRAVPCRIIPYVF